MARRGGARERKEEVRMEENRKAKRQIIKESYIRMMMVSIVVLISTNVCGFVDNIMVSRCLDTNALAAVSCFSPVSAVTGLPYIVILGTVILCGNLIGAGKPDKVNSLFTGAFFTISIFCAAMAAALIILQNPVANLLGAQGEVHRLLCEYISGYAPGIIFASLTALMTSVAPYNNAIKISYIAAGVMFFGNLLFDAVLVGPMGIFGIGLASSISSLASFLVLLPVFRKKESTIRITRCSLRTGLLRQAIHRGLPSLFFTGGLLVKNALLNYTMINFLGYEAVAVAGVMGSICGMAGTLSIGCANAYSSLMSVYWGEEDREGILDLFRFSSIVGLIVTIAFAAIMSVFSVPFTGIFFTPGTSVALLGQRMLLLGFWFLPINYVFNLLLDSYRVQGRLMLVNYMSFLEVAMVGVFAFMTVPFVGPDAAWVANLWSDVLAMIIVIVSVFVLWGRFRVSLSDFLKLPESFGAKKDEYAEYSLHDLKDVQAVSEAVTDFCRRRGAGERKAFWAGLCVEEMTSNILQHGVGKKHFYHVNVRVVCRDELTLRIEDDCARFDPRERMKMHTPESPEKNIGLRIVAGMASKVDYYNNAGINSLIIKV